MIFNPSDIRTLVHAATKRTGSPVHDEDLEQEVALRALEAFRRLSAVSHPRALLMKIVLDTVRDHWRRKRPWWEQLTTIDERFICQSPAFESTLDNERQLELLKRALERLPLSKRILIELFYITDRSIPEIAELQGRSVSAVKMELARSRRSLARIIRLLADNKARISRRSRTP